MKNLLKTIILGAGVLTMSSCDDFLDQGSPSELNTETVYNSVYYTGLTLNKAYGELTLDQTYSQYIPVVWGLNSDCELVDGLGNDAYNTASERGVMNYNASSGWANIPKVWNAMYSVIEYTNLIIEGVEGSPLLANEGNEKTTMLRYRAEAQTLRAMIYFDLVRFFGDVPMKMESSKPDLSNVYLPKTDRDVILDSLIVTLKEAVEVLPWAGEAGYTTEQATKGYAHALLANIALTRAGWAIREAAKEGYETASFSDGTYPTQRPGTEVRRAMYQLALKHLSAIISSGKHKLNPSIADHWFKVNQREMDVAYRENIFEIPMGLAKTGELGYAVGVRISGASERYGAKGNSSGKMKLTAPFLYSFDASDLRRDLTCATYELKEENKVLKEKMQSNAPFQIYVAKWDIRKMNEEWRQAAKAAGEAKCMTGINVTRMRYPYILLLYAEVMNELYGPDADGAGSAGITARQALTQVHTRAFAADDKAAAAAYVNNLSSSEFFDAIVQENAWELAGEGLRKFDLIRWNLLSDRIDRFKADYKRQAIDEKVYPTKLYYKFKPGTFEIDMSSIQWYGEPEDKTGYESTNFYGQERTYFIKGEDGKDTEEVDESKQTQLRTNLPSIASGLNTPVINRYLLPLGSTTISSSNGILKNSYGYAD